MVEGQHARLSVGRAGEFPGLNLPTFYYQEVFESALNLQLMRLFAGQSACRH